MKELEHIIGKRVKVIDRDKKVWVGKLDFIGVNEYFPSWGLCVTLDRCPGILINSIKDIEVLDEPYQLDSKDYLKK